MSLPIKAMPSATDLYLLGSGIRGTLNLTLETIQALQSCRVVFVLHDDLSVHDDIRVYCPDVRDLVELYRGETVRADVYRSITNLLIEEALQAPGVAFLVHGHPLFLVSATEYTLEAARSNNLRVRVLPAVSSFDTILCDLEVDYGYGLQMYDATSMIRHAWKPNPSLPMLIFQLATTLNDKIVLTEPDPGVLDSLVAYLAQTYPLDHTCIIVHSSAHLLESPNKLSVSLGDLSLTKGLELWRRPTLYVPPLA